MRLWKLGHVLLRVSDEEKARWFYCDVLGLKLAERDPEHGGLFTTLEVRPTSRFLAHVAVGRTSNQIVA